MFPYFIRLPQINRFLYKTDIWNIIEHLLNQGTYMNEELFVSAWKKGIKKVGTEFFNIKASSLDMAQKKWQLEPNYQFIKNEMGSYSHGKQVLLGLMYSFMILSVARNF